MTDDQAERIIKELKAIKFTILGGILVGVLFFASTRIIEAIVGPPPPPTVSIQPPR